MLYTPCMLPQTHISVLFLFYYFLVHAEMQMDAAILHLYAVAI